VDLEINGEPVEIHMKLDDSGGFPNIAFKSSSVHVKLKLWMFGFDIFCSRFEMLKNNTIYRT
jgi:hypothetical protein